MMDIIEKLGLNTPDLNTVEDCLKVFELAGMNKRCSGDMFDKAKRLKKILDEKNEMLKALIDSVLYHEYVRYTHNDIYHNNIEAIEKTTGKTWKEIKDLFN